MSKRQLSALLGLWVIVFLFLGFPSSWDKWIAVITGILIILVAYRKVQKKNPVSDSVFVQSNSTQNAANTHEVPPAQTTPTQAPTPEEIEK
jgi:hypothetical protein